MMQTYNSHRMLILALSVLLSTKTFHTNAFSSNPSQLPRKITTTTVLHAENAREPWDVLRFVRQSSKFVRPPNPFRTTATTAKVIQPGDVLWSATSPSSSSSKMTWAPLDDVVMGGVSSSTFDNNTGQWSGVVSATNNGGFVGIRTTPFATPLDLSSCKGIEFRTRGGGNGKRFKAVLRDSTEFNGICWTSSFDAPKGAKGGAVRLPFAKMIPTIFAKTVEGKTLLKENVVGFQLAYSKFEYDGGLNPKFELGDFSLQVLEIRAY
uniref:NADH:ubiquinone oxidoreductase intermediate-associated protein 30 domain-containing protein n=1 Tax=Ditylum brightwellii TaxID=49249 RepID=A0A7S4QC89_9STRA